MRPVPSARSSAACEPNVAAKVEARFREGGDFMDTMLSEQVYRCVARKGPRYAPLRDARTVVGPFPAPNTGCRLPSDFRGVYGMIGSLEEVVNDWVPLGEIYEIAAGFRGDTKEFVQTLEAALEKARASHAGQDHKTGVPLLTYFRSKGLQWHTVILTTCNEGLIPHQKAQVEEERRLFYVAMTRASSNLVISYVKSACGTDVPPSRFLYEAGLD